jgi:hypothetical protein
MQTIQSCESAQHFCFSLYKYLFIHIFWRWQPMFLWVASNFHGSFPSLQVSVPWKKWLKHVKTCWGSKSQILHEEGSDWQFLQSPNLARLIVHNSHMHLYALYFPYVCCWCSGFSVAILLDWRVVGFSHSLSPVKWMVLQQQNSKDGVEQCSKPSVISVKWFLNREFHSGQFLSHLSLLNRVV